MGVKQIVVAINKVEFSLSEERFEKMKVRILAYLKKVGYNSNNIAVVPISALYGNNVFDQEFETRKRRDEESEDTYEVQ